MGKKPLKTPPVHTTKSLQRVRITHPNYDYYYLKDIKGKDVRGVIGCRRK